MGKGRLALWRARLILIAVFYWILEVLRKDNRLHRARFAKTHELAGLLSPTPTPNSLLLGKTDRGDFVAVKPTKARPELGNLLVVAPTRGGKGLLAVSELLTWPHSVVVNDIKGDLFQQTAGYRSTLGKVFVIDPNGYGHAYDPLHGKETEDQFLSSATHLLFRHNEGDGAIFTQRATVMLAQMFLASRLEQIAPLPYVRLLIRLGLTDTASRLNTISPELARQFLDENFYNADLTNRFLVSAWETLSARMRPLLTETLVRTLTHSDFTPDELMSSGRVVSVYLRWKEQDLLALSSLIRLIWDSFIYDLIGCFDQRQGKNCRPVLLLIDEAGRTAIPSLADYASTVVGRGISLWVAIQSLSQLDSVYGKIRATSLRDNMESQIYYRPSGDETAEYLERRLGDRVFHAYSLCPGRTLRGVLEGSLG